MLPVVVFSLIILVAGLSISAYYLSTKLSMRERPSKKPKHEKSANQALHVHVHQAQTGHIAEAASVPSHEAEEAAGSETESSDKELEEDYAFGLKCLFLPDEAGIYHDAEKLTDRGWSDLDYTLVALSRLPSEVSELLDVLNNPDSSASDVSAICERSVGLTARVLKLVNSPFYGLNSPVDDIQRAVTLLGFDEMRQIILTTSIFRSQSAGAGLLDIDELWSHSLATARISSWLADRVKIQVRKGLAGTGAMLHDVGKVVLQAWRPEAFRKALQQSRERKTSLMIEELKELGVTHALAGTLLLGRWNLPVTLSRLVKGCHLPIIADDMPEAALIYISGQIARHMAMGADGETAEERSQADIRRFLGISAETVTELVSEGFEEHVKGVLQDIRARITV